MQKTRKIKDSNNGTSSAVLQKALDIEGSVRNTGIRLYNNYPDDITNYVPIALAKDSECIVHNMTTQEDGFIENGLLGLNL